MRTPRAYRFLERAFRAGKQRGGMRLIEYTVLSNHLHLIVEVKNRAQLARGMQGLNIRLAKALNRHWLRKGRVFADRYFAVVVKSPRQAMKVLKYVLNNARKHGVQLAESMPDPFSSARWFSRWLERPRKPLRSPPVVEAWSWEPWRLISLNEIPGQRAESWTLEELLAQA
jgi:REP element-mobilizing transposase RayT